MQPLIFPDTASTSRTLLFLLSSAPASCLIGKYQNILLAWRLLLSVLSCSGPPPEYTIRQYRIRYVVRSILATGCLIPCFFLLSTPFVKIWTDMAFVWIQQWVALPVLLEEQMGDISTRPGSQPLDITAAGLAHDEHQSNPKPSPPNLTSTTSSTPFYSQFSSIPQVQLRPNLRSPAQPTSPHYPPPDHGSASLNMGTMAGALPEYGSVDVAQGSFPVAQHNQRHLSGASTSALVYQLQQNLQVAGPPSGSLHAYGPGFSTGQFPPNFVPTHPSQHLNYSSFPPNSQRVPAPGPMQPSYQNFPPQPSQPSQYLYYPAPYGSQAQYSPGFPEQNLQNQAMYGRRPSLSGSHVPMGAHNLELPQQDGNFYGGVVGSVFGGQSMPVQGKETLQGQAMTTERRSGNSY